MQHQGFEYENSVNDRQENSQPFAGSKIQQGPTTLPSGAVYEGEWRNEQREGYGR